MTHGRGLRLGARRTPRQARSQSTVSALLDATVKVLLERGFSQCTTNRVAEVAGVGIGSLYEYFPNKEALVAALVEREVATLASSLERALIAVPRERMGDVLGVWFKASLDDFERRRELFRLLLVEYPYFAQLPSVLQFPGRVAQMIASQLTESSDPRSADDGRGLRTALGAMLGGLFLSQMLTPAVSHAEVGDAVSEILQLVLDSTSRAR